MTPADLAAARELCERATQGPWGVSSDDKFSAIVIEAGQRDVCTLDTYRHRPDECADDAAFIATSRTLVPSLLDLVSQQAARIAELEGSKADAWSQHDDMERERDVIERERGQLRSQLATVERERDSYANSDFERQLDESRREADSLRRLLSEACEIGEDAAHSCDYDTMRKKIDRITAIKTEAGIE